MTYEVGFPEGKLFIGGEWVDAGGGTSPVENPATEETVCEVGRGSAEDVDRAVSAAQEAFRAPEWAGLPAADRGRLLWKLSEAIQDDVEQLARLETWHNGKPIFESQYVDIPSVARCFSYYAGWATKITGETLPIQPGAFTYTRREPVGVVGAIVPWNFPLLLASWKIAPALAAGCTVVLKPASLTPLTALRLAKLAEEVGFPPGVLNVVSGPGREVGEAMVRHPGIAKIAFTGETSTGRGILERSAETLKRVTLELGGKSPNIVLPDADVDAAAKGAAIGIFYGKGEVCAAGSRLLVHSDIHDQVVEKLAQRSERMVPSDPMHPKTKMGALVSRSQLDKVASYVSGAKEEGAELVAGGEATQVEGKGYFHQATVFTGVKPEMTIAREEIFGPVLAVLSFDDVDEAVAMANDSPYGLAAAVWTRDVAQAHRVASRLEAGTVWVNTYNMYDAALPFGGYKESGIGRELGSTGLEPYLETKSVWVSL